MRELCLDNILWKKRCFNHSPWYQSLINRRASQTPFTFSDGLQDGDLPDEPQTGGSSMIADDRGEDDEATIRARRHAQRLQDMANWDPTFPKEKVSWYDEYIQRQGSACVNWLATPRMSAWGLEAIIEARGVALYSPYDGDDGIGTKLAVAPLDDGSVCLWDVNGTRGRQGGILAKSQPDLLYMEGFRDNNARLRSQRIDSSISDRVSVDQDKHKAYFAVQSRKFWHAGGVLAFAN